MVLSPEEGDSYAPRSGPYSQRRPCRTSRVGEDLAARGAPVRGRRDQPPRICPRPLHRLGLRPRRAGAADVDLGVAQLDRAGRTARSTCSTRPASRASSPTRSARCACASRPCSSINAVMGVEVTTSRLWARAAELDIARMLFVNMLDRERADFFRDARAASSARSASTSWRPRSRSAPSTRPRA